MCSPNIPDTSAAQMQANQLNYDLATKNMAMQDEALKYFKERQVGVDADAKIARDRAFELAETTTAQGTDLYNYQKEVFRPVEQSLVAQAMRESTPEYYEKYAQQAVAKQAMANDNARQQMEQNLASMGVNPNSGAFASAQRGLTLANAAGLGAVANESYDRAEGLGWARRADVAGIGKGLVGAGNASYGIATTNNSAGTGATNAATGLAGSTLGTATQYGGMAVQGANNAASGYNDIYRTQTSAAGQSGGGLMGAVGNMAGQWAGSAAGSAAIAAFI